MTLRALSPMGWAALIAVVVLAAALLYYLAGRPGRDAATRAEAGATISQGRAAAGADAVGEVVKNTDKAGAIDDRVKDSENAIRNAPPADADGVTLRELCRSASARRQPHCLQRANP